MYIYTGKLNWLQLAVNESITIVVPAGFALNDPICAYWQWTVTTQGQKKVNACFSTVIDNVSKTGDKYQVDFTFGGAWSFNAIVASDFNTFTATMRNPKGDRSKPMALARQYGNPGQVPSTSVYTGKLNWAKNAQNELVTLVIPGDVSNVPRWLDISDANVRVNENINTHFRINTAINHVKPIDS
ncbi:hypothetical protein MPER_02814 [Moniliophthora perniciosa FA553]|nr:hypothetical protein MPER_02814 [Moniliophthora perniciosa FA553]